MNKNFPTLYQESTTGKTKVWDIKVEDGTYYVEHGLEGGKMQLDQTTVEIKNKGKANQTTPFDQACSEAESKWKKKKDKGYCEIGESRNKSIVFPMLAQNFKDSKHRLIYPLYTQPKLNGVRCTHTDKYQSRGGKFWNTLSHLDDDVAKLQKLVGYPLDGEIFIKGLDLQDISSLVKKERVEEKDSVGGYLTKDLEYWIYDIVDTESVFPDRNTKLFNAFSKIGAKLIDIDGITFMKINNLVYVATFLVLTEEQLLSYKHQFIATGFEGGMARNNVGYVLCPGSHHSHELQKLKDVLSDEYEIIGAKSGTGRFEGCATFICKTKEGLEFDCTPMGSIERKKHYLKDIENIKGKMGTILYQELTKDGIPSHGRLEAIRELGW
jgi:hypothetical protein